MTFGYTKKIMKDAVNQIYLTMIFPVVLNECETLSLTLYDEAKLIVIRNKILKML